MAKFRNGRRNEHVARESSARHRQNLEPGRALEAPFQMKKHYTLVLLILTTCWMARAEQPMPRYFSVSPGALAEAKARLAGGDQLLQPALRDLVEQADEALQTSPPSVTEKTRTPPSGDKHDYLSLATYWWPDPASSNGMPYIRHDGKVNPESREDAFDFRRNRLMASTVEML